MDLGLRATSSRLAGYPKGILTAVYGLALVTLLLKITFGSGRSELN